MRRKAMPRCKTWIFQRLSLRQCVILHVTEGVLCRMHRAKVTENAVLEFHLQNWFKFCIRVAKSLDFCSVQGTCLFLTFIWPCIVNVFFYVQPTRCNVIQYSLLLSTLYRFRTVLPPINRSSRTVHTTSGMCQACLFLCINLSL